MSCAGLVPVMRLAQSVDLHGIVGERLRIPGDKGANASGKVAAVVAGMLTGADSIDDLDVIRHGGMPGLFGGVYAPSTLGEFLRVHARPRPPTPGGLAGVPGTTGSQNPANARRGRGHVHRRGLTAAPGLRHKETGRRVRPSEGGSRSRGMDDR